MVQQLIKPSNPFFSQLAQWTRAFRLNHKKRKAVVQPQSAPAQPRRKIHEVDRTQFPSFWQWTTLYRTTYQKLHKKALPLWVIFHLRSLLRQLQYQITQHRKTSGWKEPIESKTSSPWSRKRYIQRRSFASSTVVYTMDLNTEKVTIQPLAIQKDEEEDDDDIPLGTLKFYKQ
ncbi:hypothetical protein DFQ28_008420 [Apophysomyces sp. BC1034]|nr:hypothetical protein DFQ30_006193 [Apophysomyces sp. BC1015]KAG0180626.1 hypothetical protein DFQ29_000286 [Apophysomyces sp. BC1021]KAG0186044.1 hypothetical protein DFQ28_008420 [Apophysomyces sp. BC1034]